MKNYTQEINNNTKNILLFLIGSEVLLSILLAIGYYYFWNTFTIIPVLILTVFYLIDLVFNVSFFKEYKKTNGFTNVIIHENHKKAVKIMNNIISENKSRYEIGTAFYKSKKVITFFMNICARRQNEFYSKLIKDIEQ